MPFLNLMDLYWFLSSLFWDKLIVFIHEAIYKNLAVLKNYSSNYTIWRNTDSLQWLVVASIIVHDLDYSRSLLCLRVVNILLYLARSIPDSASTKPTWLSSIVSITTRNKLLEVPNFDDLSFFYDRPLLVKLVINSWSEKELSVEVNNFIDVVSLVMDHKLFLNLHIFCQVKILDLWLIAKGLYS